FDPQAGQLYRGRKHNRQIKVALNRRVASKADKEDQERCLLEGVDCLLKCAPRTVRGGGSNSLKGVITHFKDHELCLLHSDKEGGFVTLPRGTFNKKAAKAIEKNFAPVNAKASNTRSRFVDLCKSLDLTKLAKDVSKCKIDALSVFFSAKTHKPSVPFRAIVSEKGRWQLLASQFLLKHLKCLQVTDPFLTKRSDEVADFFQDNQSIGYAFSVDIEDLFYSVPHCELFSAVRECIDVNGVVSFQNTAGVSVEDFLNLLEAYLNSTFISLTINFIYRRKAYALVRA
ncbi:uncharacterized protein LOC115320030, partial [Ixodes scapularis]|uniref:uncharacterized protein LOC115320030 n=1 Tax=Ixodes scapularis TaxID=6945 RepID=UPI001A9DED16